MLFRPCDAPAQRDFDSNPVLFCFILMCVNSYVAVNSRVGDQAGGM